MANGGRFRLKQLGHILVFKNGKSIKPCGVGKYPVYGSNGIIGGCDEHTEENGIILGRVGAYCGSVSYSPGKFWASDNTIVAYPIDAEYDVLFLSYFLKTLNLNRWAGGAAQPLLTQTVLKQVEGPVPHLPTQQKIAAMLSAYDDLIENNLRRIKILEEMAQNLYREWFIKYRFPGHEKARFVDSPLGKIPEGWEVKDIVSIAEVTYGFAFQSRLFNSTCNGIPIVRIRDILTGTSDTYSPEKAEKKYVVENGDILVGMDGDFHVGCWVGGQAHLVQRVARFRPKQGLGWFHLILALREPIQHFNATITGTTVAHLGDKHIKTIQLKWATQHLRQEFNQLLEPMYAHILNIRLRNTILSRTRDLLLPKLTSGEVDVSELDIEIPRESDSL